MADKLTRSAHASTVASMALIASLCAGAAIVGPRSASGWQAGETAAKDMAAERDRKLLERLLEIRGYALAAQIMNAAISSWPQLAEERNGLRYDAACAAALAGCGLGRDAPAPDEDYKAKLRAQAGRWLEAELKAWTDVIAADGGRRQEAFKRIQWWRQDGDFGGVREESELAKLPAAEAAVWRNLWKQVGDTLQSIQAAGP